MCVCVCVFVVVPLWQQSIWRLKDVRGKLSITCRILFCPPNYTMYVGMQKITIWVSKETKNLNFMLLLEMFLDNNRLLADQPDRCYTINNISLHSWQFNLIYCRRMRVCVCVANNHNQEEGCNIMVPNSFFFSFVIAKLLLHITIHVLLITTALIVVCWDLTGKVGNNFLQRQWQRRLQLRINLPSNNQSRYILKSVHIPACLLVMYYHQ